jgi:eukaryotic-like serine/threonine-protein kinase
MSDTRHGELQRLFLHARELAPAERTRFLAEECADGTLREEVEALLEADEGSGFLDAGLPGLQSVAALSGNVDPERIGAFRIVRELGRGGMGVVYLGERADGQFEQTVAIKIVGADAADDAMRRRFLSERSILAGLKHPHIARLLDGGITPDGRPYLILEYVDGLPITAYCDAHRLDIRARLRLFLDICAAVQHAHAQLIIHRDIKPGNILVDAEGRVHLLDFGIARLLAAEGNAIATTHADLRAMTPEYASPEQVRGENLGVATDVYSLGVLLYELMCGTGPYTVTARGAIEIAHAVCTQEPVRPSERALRDIAHGSTARERASARSTTAERLSRALAGDLDSIIMMALRKEPEARYASVASLRDDLERYFGGRPVQAHRGNARYRAYRFVRRHRTVVLAAGLAGVSLLGGAAAAAWQAHAANAERDRAERALADAEALTALLTELFRTGELDDGRPGADVTAADLLRRGAIRADELSDRPLVQARLLAVIGTMSLDLGRFAEAQSMLQRAAELQREGGDEAALELSTTLLALGRVQSARGDHEAARTPIGEALSIRRARLAPTDPGIADALQQLGNVHGGVWQEEYYREALVILEQTGTAVEEQVRLLQGLTTNQRRRGQLDLIVATDREALRRAREAFGDDDHRTGQAMVHLADQIVYAENDAATAEALYIRGTALIEKRYGHSSTRLLHGLHALASLYGHTGRLLEAEHLLRRTLAIRTAATGSAHPAIVNELRLLALVLARQGRSAEAETLVTDALARLDSNDVAGARPRALTLQALAEVLHRQGRTREADSVFQQVPPLYGGTGVMLGEAMRDYGRLLAQGGRSAEAEPMLLGSLSLVQLHYGNDEHPNVLESKRALAALYRETGRSALASRYDVPPGRFIAY